MTTKVAKVLKGFIKLSPSERLEFINELNKYQRESSLQSKKIFEDDVQRLAALGPKDTICDCCGR